MLRKSIKILIPAILGAAALAGCSSASGGSATTAQAGSTTSLQQREISAAEKFVAAAEQAPTRITLTTPLPSAPPKGKTIVWLSCGDVSATCPIIGAAIQSAAQAAGWTYKQINFDQTNPATLTTAFEKALQLHPAAVAELGTPPTAGWSSVIPAYEAAGVPIIASYLGATQTSDKGIIANVGGPADRETSAVRVAEWFIANSHAQGHAILESVNAFPVLQLWASQFAATVKANCSACTVTDLQNTISDVANNSIVSSIVPDLQRNPADTYLISSDLEFLDQLPSALSAAGLKGKVQVAGATPDTAGLADVKDGVFAAATPLAISYSGYLMADVAFRYVMHLPIPAADQGALPGQLLTPGTPFTVSESYNKPADYVAQVERLWHIGS